MCTCAIRVAYLPSDHITLTVNLPPGFGAFLFVRQRHGQIDVVRQAGYAQIEAQSSLG